MEYLCLFRAHALPQPGSHHNHCKAGDLSLPIVADQLFHHRDFSGSWTPHPIGTPVSGCLTALHFVAVATEDARDVDGEQSPPETMSFIASSTLISTDVTSCSGTNKKYPDVGFGDVGTYTWISGSCERSCISPLVTPVTKAIQ